MCRTGFTGNGKNCTDIDECAEKRDDCHTNATCSDVEGSFTCTCDSGYTGNGTHCGDIDECTAPSHNCAINSTCTNNNGSFSCACNIGHTGNGTTCIGIYWSLVGNQRKL